VISNAIDYAKFYSRLQNAAICVYDLAGDINRKLYSAYEAERICLANRLGKRPSLREMPSVESLEPFRNHNARTAIG